MCNTLSILLLGLGGLAACPQEDSENCIPEIDLGAVLMENHKAVKLMVGG